MRRRSDPRAGSSEKSKDERSHEPFDHQPRVSDVRIRNACAEIEEEPERYAYDSKQNADRKEHAKRFFATGAYVLRTHVIIEHRFFKTATMRACKLIVDSCWATRRRAS